MIVVRCNRMHGLVPCAAQHMAQHLFCRRLSNGACDGGNAPMRAGSRCGAAEFLREHRSVSCTTYNADRHPSAHRHAFRRQPQPTRAGVEGGAGRDRMTVAIVALERDEQIARLQASVYRLRCLSRHRRAVPLTRALSGFTRQRQCRPQELDRSWGTLIPRHGAPSFKVMWQPL